MSHDDDYDDDFKDLVTAELDDRLREEELETAMDSLSLGKASGFDNFLL